MPSSDGCKQCGGAMDAGFAAVSVDGMVAPLLWIQGEITRGLIRGGASEERERVPLRALRCNQCGHVAFVGRSPA